MDSRRQRKLEICEARSHLMCKIILSGVLDSHQHLVHSQVLSARNT